MSTRFLKIVISTNLLVAQGGWAACPAPTSSEDVVKCALGEAPGAKRASGQALEAEATIDAASQLPNPELEGDYVGRKGESETTLSLQVPVSGFLVRGARKSAAEATFSASQASLISARGRIKIETILKLHRLRQHLREKELVGEALHTFEKLVKQYSSRAQLAPEQEVSLSVFRMAESDYKLQHSTLVEEEAQLNNFFSTTVGIPLEQIRKVLPKPISTWPETEVVATGTSENTAPEIKVAEAELKRAEAEQSLARISSWPELKIGPMMKRLNTGSESSTSWGAALSLPLPILSLNGGERNRAAKAKSNAEVNLQLTTMEIARKREELATSYQSAVRSLQGGLSASVLSKNHERLERLFLRGIVSSPLVIEAHRQLVDLEKGRNQKELIALEALWSMRALDGRIFEETL